MRESEAVYVVGVLAAGFVKELPRESIGIYADEIVGEDYAVAIAAVRRLIREREFFPPVAAVLDAIRRERAAVTREAQQALPSGTGVALDELAPEAQQAWQSVRRAIHALRMADAADERGADE